MPLKLRAEHRILLIEMDNPPVNCLSLDLRRELHEALTHTAADPRFSAVLLFGSGKYFCAGADLRELGTAQNTTAPRLSADILPAIERCSKPVIAAIQGGAVGGGFELALACHYRVALKSARIALPEVRHGIIPLSGAIRLPRIWGIARAMPMIVDSTVLSANDFDGSAVFDYLAPSGDAELTALEQLLSVAIPFVRDTVLPHAAESACRHRLIRNRQFSDEAPEESLIKILAGYDPRSLSAAQAAAITAVRAGIAARDFDSGLAESQRLYDELLQARGRQPD